MKTKLFLVAGIILSLSAWAQTNSQTTPAVEPLSPMPVFHVTVTSRSVQAVNYKHRSGASKLDFAGTDLMPAANGQAKVESKKGYTEIEAEFDELVPPDQYGREYLTYVLWAVTPQGRSLNLGELIRKGTRSKLDVTTDLQSFGLIVTAEPYFAVTQPTDRVVLENYVRPDTKGVFQEITTHYELLDKNNLAYDRMPGELKPTLIDTSLPLDLQEARHAVNIAQWAGADRYAPDLMSSTRDLLYKAEEYFVRKTGAKAMSMTARTVVQNAEDARLIAMNRRQNEERKPTPTPRRRK